jgi:hypothetical protein
LLLTICIPYAGIIVQRSTPTHFHLCELMLSVEFVKIARNNDTLSVSDMTDLGLRVTGATGEAKLKVLALLVFAITTWNLNLVHFTEACKQRK